MFNIGAGEMVFILVAALLVLGPSRLPEMARAIGKFMREFRRQTDDVRVMVEREFYRMDEQELRQVAAPQPGVHAGDASAAVAPGPAHVAPTAVPEPVPLLQPAPHAVARGATAEDEPAVPAPAREGEA